jgi:hypothetical protein
VIAEVAAAHPLTALNPLWRRFHGLGRLGPVGEDFLAALAELDLDLSSSAGDARPNQSTPTLPSWST